MRELKNAVERAAIMADTVIGPELLPHASVGEGAAAPGRSQTLQVRIGSSLAEVEHRVILATLHDLGEDKKQAAKVLGISLKTLHSRLSACHWKWQGDAGSQAGAEARCRGSL